MEKLPTVVEGLKISAKEVRADFLQELNNVMLINRFFAAGKMDYAWFEGVNVLVDSGKYCGELLPVLRVQMDSNGVSIWTKVPTHNRPIKVTGSLEVAE
jgi:hypothetical protein